MKIEAIDIC